VPFIEELLDRTEYTVKWVSPKRSEVYVNRRLYNGDQVSVGCCFIGTQEDCRKYIGSKISGLAISCGKLYDIKGRM
jgi:hypothetical protein